MKEFSDSHISTKFGAGSYSLSMMQSLSSKLLGGFEMIYVVSYPNSINNCVFYSLTPEMYIFAMVQTTTMIFIHSIHNTFQWQGKKLSQSDMLVDQAED